MLKAAGLVLVLILLKKKQQEDGKDFILWLYDQNAH